MNQSTDTLVRVTTKTIDQYLALDGWEQLAPLPRDGGLLYRAQKGKSVVQAHSISELCRRTWDIERGWVRMPDPWKDS